MTSLPHLTRVPKNEDIEIKSHALYVSMPPGEVAQAVSAALVEKFGDDSGGKKSAFVCACVVSGVIEPIARKRSEHALDITDKYAELPDLTPREREILTATRMAVLGCETATAREFTGKKSQGYIERYGDEQDNT